MRVRPDVDIKNMLRIDSGDMQTLALSIILASIVVISGRHVGNVGANRDRRLFNIA